MKNLNYLMDDVLYQKSKIILSIPKKIIHLLITQQSKYVLTMYYLEAKKNRCISVTDCRFQEFAYIYPKLRQNSIDFAIY